MMISGRAFIRILLFAFGIVTIVGMGLLTKAVLDIESKTYYVIPPTPVAPEVASPTFAAVDVKTINLNSDELRVCRISVICFWIFIFVCLFIRKI